MAAINTSKGKAGAIARMLIILGVPFKFTHLADRPKGTQAQIEVDDSRDDLLAECLRMATSRSDPVKGLSNDQ